MCELVNWLGWPFEWFNIRIKRTPIYAALERSDEDVDRGDVTFQNWNNYQLPIRNGSRHPPGSICSRSRDVRQSTHSNKRTWTARLTSGVIAEAMTGLANAMRSDLNVTLLKWFVCLSSTALSNEHLSTTSFVRRAMMGQCQRFPRNETVLKKKTICDHNHESLLSTWPFGDVSHDAEAGRGMPSGNVCD